MSNRDINSKYYLIVYDFTNKKNHKISKILFFSDMRVLILLVGILSARDRQNHNRRKDYIATSPTITESPLDSATIESEKSSVVAKDDRISEDIIEPEIKESFLVSQLVQNLIKIVILSKLISSTMRHLLVMQARFLILLTTKTFLSRI